MHAFSRPDHRDVVRPGTTVQALHLLVARLTPRDRRIMRLVHRHKTLTTAQLAQLEFASYSVAKRRLLTLYRLRALERFRPWTPVGSAPWHYILDTPGAELLAAEHGKNAHEWGFRRTRMLSMAYRSTLNHTVGTNDFFVDLAVHASARDDAGLTWRTERECAAEFGDIVRPDAAGRWRSGTRELDFFLEYDTGSESLGRLAEKLDRYSELRRSTGRTATVLFWLPSPARQTNVHRLLGPRAREVPAATGLHGAHPAQRVWTPLGTARQHTLADLGSSGGAAQPMLPGWDAEFGNARSA
ncbi:replication-relaxation family protein [Nocardiopsis coralliicola]